MRVLQKRLIEKYSAVLPHRYRELSYIESTGMQYIALTLPHKNIALDLDFQLLSADGLAFGMGYYVSSTDCYQIGTNSGKWFIRINNTIHNTTASDTLRHTFSIDSNGCVSIDNSYLFTAASTEAKNDELYLFCRKYEGIPSSFAQMRIYSLIIKADGKNLYDLRPAMRLSDNSVGLYDLQGTVCPLSDSPFYISSSNSQFIYS